MAQPDRGSSRRLRKYFVSNDELFIKNKSRRNPGFCLIYYIHSFPRVIKYCRMADKKAHVEIFGNTIDDGSCDGDRRRGHCRGHHQDAPVLGVMFLFGGILLFLNVIGQVPWSIWHVIWQFWPVILIFIGIQILSGIILFFLAVFVFGIIILYSLQSIGSPIFAHMNLPFWIIQILADIRRIMP